MPEMSIDEIINELSKPSIADRTQFWNACAEAIVYLERAKRLEEILDDPDYEKLWWILNYLRTGEEL